ncbi:flagellar hook-length control protein FliK [Bradyrhizobium erythrophlei]|uniref:Hook-length control protein FliK n=1 Tax=Bradyrhizobium erythrophlei TaxID=1437360 RepID=A0A1M5THZ4_9BRAD|nr:flagellar hook-length control protein FliK [Bradyrhizobium erythrophlei]SHH49973.1 hook-length control protein FliK [Bradyrhizobium erythrophlei]
MSIVITPLIQPAAAQAATPVVLQSGSVISARVQQVLTNNIVRIAIAGQSIDVLSQVPLQAGQTLQLAVSQANDGTVRLAVVNPQDAAAAAQAPAQAANAAVTPDTVTLAPGAVASIAPQTTPAVAAPQIQLTAQETLAVALATQTAATQQTSLAPLFANLAVASGLAGLPPQLQQAVAQVLAQRTSLDQNLTGNDIKQAFQSSGLFLEASLAAGTPSSAAATPDLKAALIVLRQVLATSLNGAQAPAAVVAPGTIPAATLVLQGSASAVMVVPQGTAVVAQQATTPAAAAVVPQGTAAALVIEQGTLASATVAAQPVTTTPVQETPLAASPALAPLLSTGTVTSVTLQGAAMPNAEVVFNTGVASQIILPPSTPAGAVALAAASSAALNLLQEAVQATPLIPINPSGLLLENNQMLALVPAVSGGARPVVDEAEMAHTNVPPPPISGALPTAQPVLPATLVSNSPAESAMHRLLADTDAAIARQTLLQVASLPGQADPATGRVDPVAQRWNFEIPFVTPQGTAMAQFEISRDGGGNEVAAAKQVWRARFSLDVEPAGPVHALVSLVGDRTSVRMWAERPATAAQLRAGAAQLSQALCKAELKPGDIVIRDGVPPQPVPARAGHFLDRAL